jgi:hypothetical protein
MRQGRQFPAGATRVPESRRSDVDRSRSSNYPDRNTRKPIATRRVTLLGVVGLAVLTAFAPGCAHELDTERAPSSRGSVGEEMYGVICDRVAAQALREDLSGDSFRRVCHRPKGGEFADEVDQSKLPPVHASATDVDGNRVSVEKQRADRDKAVGRVEALARRRGDLIRALDATFPEQKVPIKDLDNPDPKKTCNAPKKSGEGLLTEELADMMGRMGDLYNDGTIPQSTQSLATVVEAFKASPEAQAAWARLSAREGYRPIETALGAARPVIAYPHLRDLANASLRLLSADSNPYAIDPPRDTHGNRLPVPGPGNAALNHMLAAAHEELLAAKVDPRLPDLRVKTDAAGRVVLSRPRDNVEMMQEVLFASDPAFGSGSPRYIVRRDPRGYAAIAGGAVPRPFVDSDGDGLPDVDDLGRFVTTDGSLAPSPFPFPNGPEGPRDELGRALAGQDRLLYEYLDTSHTFAAQVLLDMKALASPDPEKDALMGMLGGLHVAIGPRVPRTKTYAGKTLEFDGVDVARSPLLDLVHAAAVILSDRNADATLALVRELFSSKQKEMARLTGAMLDAQNIASRHDEAKIPREATFWDENLDVMAEIAKVRGDAPGEGLLEDLLRALAAPESADIGTVISKYAELKDEVTYDRNDINGAPWNLSTNSKSEMRTPVDRSQPLTGKNRSALYRFLQLINDTTGVTACNKPNAFVHAKLAGISVTMPLGSVGYKECEAFKLENVAEFYVGAIAEGWRYPKSGKGQFYLRDDTLRNGILGIGAATVGLMEDSSGINGFWTPSGSRTLAPKPEWLNRLVFFDVKNDSPTEGLINFKTNRFLTDLQGPNIGTSVCPERVISDPKPNAADASPDGKVRGLRNCAEGQWLAQRGANTIFTWEHFGFYRSMKPIAAAFAKHGREDLFVALANAAYKHWPGEEASANECRLPGGKTCPRSGMNTYEPTIAEVFGTDVLPALHELAKALDTLPIERCVEVGGRAGECTRTEAVSGIVVAADAARAALDPDYAKNVLRLTDRRGSARAKRNDGSEAPQVTPAYLIANAMSAIDAAFDDYEAQHPDQKDRRADWRRARSQLADQFLGVSGIRSNSQFTNAGIAKMTPAIIDMLRSQLLAHCPRSFSPPYETCTWAREELVKKAEESLAGPLASTGLEMMDAVRGDVEGRKQMGLMVQYLLDAASQNDALASILASTNDLLQILRDEENLVPLLHVVAHAMDASERDEDGRVTKKSLVDAQMALLAKMSGRYFDADGDEICKNEIDPNQVLAIALGNLVTPIKDGDFRGQTPLEVIIDVIADVNREDPTQPYEGTLAREDYASVSQNVVEFLTDKERGLEQFYEVIRQGTRF